MYRVLNHLVLREGLPEGCVARSQVSTVIVSNIFCSESTHTDLTHLCRRLCRPSGPDPLGDQLAGHPARISLFQSVNEWVKNTHDYAFMTLMCTAVQLRGGIDAAFTSPHVVVFKLTRVDEPKNPAGAFLLSPEVPLVVKREDLGSRDNWEELDEACRRQTERFRAGPNPHPCYVGSLPAMIWVQGTNIAAYHPFPIYSLRTQGTGPLNDLTSIIFEHVVAMCVGTMNAGLVLHGPKGPCRPHELLPDVGVLVKRKKTWEWKKEEGWVWNRSVSLRGGLEPQLLWQAFYVF